MPLPALKAAALAAIASFATIGAAGAQTRTYDYTTHQWVTTGSSRAVVSQGAATATRPVARQPQAMRPVDPKFQRQSVRVSTKEAPGTIIIDTDRKFLYFVEAGGTATRYGVGVGKEGFAWGGNMKVGRKAEWPGWTPPPAMIRRERAKGVVLPAYMPGGPNNPLGARALYLYRGGADSMFRIHGTNQPWTIGLNMSSGCIRMMNQDVEHLYERVKPGTKVIVVGPGQSPAKVIAETGRARAPKGGLLQAVFGG